MPNEAIYPVRISGWTSGVNREADDATLEATELSLAENITLGLNGELSRRRGYTEYTTAMHANMGVGERLFFWNQLGSTSDYFIYIDADGDVFKSTGTNFSSAADFDIAAPADAEKQPIGIEVYRNIVYVTSLRANARKFDGTNWTEITDYTPNASGDEFPRAAFLATKHERFFAANIDNNGTLERSRVRWSNLGDVETWDTVAWVDVDPDDGTEIRGLIPFADGLVIFKDRAVFFLSGVDESSFTMFPIDSTVGTTAPGSIAVTESAVYFLDTARGVYKFDGAQVERLSDKINTELLADIENADVEKFHGIYFRDKYYLCLNDGTDQNITWVYDNRNEGWVKWSCGWLDSAVRDAKLYVVGVTDSAGTQKEGIYQLLNGNSDDGVAFTAKARTGWSAPQDIKFMSSPRFRIRYVDVVAVEGAGTLTVNLYEDFNETANAGTADLDRSGYDHVHRRVKFDAALQSGRTTFQLELSMTSTSNTFTVAGIDVLISARRRVRGGNI